VPTADLDLTPVEMDCARCGRSALMRFRGLCEKCRDELHTKFTRDGREMAVEEYVPKMNVTPNAVALKED
jgi:NMD protein affecting ribosome stability and mRNA decay